MHNSAEKPQRRSRGFLNGLLLFLPIMIFAGVGLMLYGRAPSMNDVIAPPVLVLPRVADHDSPTAAAMLSNSATASEAAPDDADSNAIVASEPDEAAEDVVEETATETVANDALDNPSVVDRLVIVTDRAQLITVNPDGSEPHELTRASDRVAYQFPAWSPSGAQIAAIGGGRGSEPSGIFVFEDSAEPTSERIFTDTRTPIYLYWTPDGEAVSFITTRTDDSSLLDFRIVPKDGDDRSEFLAFGAPFFWDFASTSDNILFKTTRTTHAEFAFIDRNDGEMSDEIADASVLFQSPDISHDDAYIAYGGGVADARELVIENRDSGERVTTEHLAGLAFSWSPTANVLAYAAAERPSPRPYGPLRLFDTDGTVSNLVDDAVVAFFWSPDGTKIAYLTVGSLNGDGPDARFSRTQLASLPRQERSFVLELYVVDIASAEKQLLGAFTPGPLFVLQFLPFYDQYARSHSIWAPDSSALAMPVQDEDGNSVIFRFGLDGSRPTPIAPGQVGFWSRK